MDHVLLRGLSALGLVSMIALAWAMSEKRSDISWRLVLWSVVLQLAIAVPIFTTGLGQRFFDVVQRVFTVISDASLEGATFVFGELATDFEVGAIVAFQVLPVIVFASGLAAMLYHLRVIQAAVHFMAWAMRRTLKTSGAETFGAALLIFLGVESMPAIKGYLLSMTRSELFTVMTTFMATVAASVMVSYANFGAAPGHLLAASLMSAPAAIALSKIMVPETEYPKTQGKVSVRIPVQSHNIVDAAARGGSEGLMLALNVGAMFIVFIGSVYLINLLLTALVGVSFTQVMGWIFVPFAFMMGVPSSDVIPVAELLGKKTVLNEFLAFADFRQLKDGGKLDERSVTIATYALCGFANPGSLGILVAALANLIPERRGTVTQLGIKSVVSGTLAGFMTACVAGILA